FIPAELMLGFGFSICSDTESTLLYDTLAVLGRTGDYRRIESRAEFATRLGAAVSSITGGLLASFGLRLPFYVNTATATMLPLTAVMLREPVRRRPQSARIWQDIRQAVQHSVRDRHIRSAALITGAILTTGIIAIWGYFLLLADLGVPLAWYGVLFFLFQAASAVGARASHAVTQRTGRRGALLLFLGIPAIFLVIGAVPVQGLLLLAFVQSFLWGLSTPFFLDIINARAIPELRATVLSTVSMGGRLLYVLAGPLFGMIVDAAGVRAGFVFLTIVLGICLGAALALRHAARPQPL
ncbi:MAG TPA: hypothetical protein PKM88_05135, partial [bacterium]|nr:hypothetical protein [bacterium]